MACLKMCKQSPISNNSGHVPVYIEACHKCPRNLNKTLLQVENILMVFSNSCELHISSFTEFICYVPLKEGVETKVSLPIFHDKFDNLHVLGLA